MCVKVLTWSKIIRWFQNPFCVSSFPFCEVVSPGACIGVGIPGLLLHSKGSLRKNGAEPGWDVFADVIDLVCVLTRASGSVLVRLVLQDLHPAALAAALLSALFLQGSRKMTVRREVTACETCCCLFCYSIFSLIMKNLNTLNCGHAQIHPRH